MNLSAPALPATAGAPRSPKSGSGERAEDRLTSAGFAEIARILRRATGIELPDGKQALIEGRLRRKLAGLGAGSFGDYVDALSRADEKGDTSGALRLLAPLTTNTTRFAREPHHFDALRQEVLPSLAARAQAGGRVRLWSAACSTGEEAWDMGMALLEAIPGAGDLDCRVLATDISRPVLERARSGTYATSLLGSLPRAARDRWFESTPGGARVGPTLARVVAFRHLNLMGDWPMVGPFDAIFCRNVSIYFDAETKARLWTRLAALLAPGGQLMIGHSERIAGPAERLVQLVGTTRYARVA